MPVIKFGDRAAQIVSQRIGAPQASLAATKALGNKVMADGQLFLNGADNSLWKYSIGSTTTADDILVSNPGSGRLLRALGPALISLPFTFATADAAVLLTIPTGCVIHVRDFYWTASVSFTGGSSSAIGVSSTNVSGHTTKGDFLGGSGGDVLATLAAAATPILGTAGAAMDTIAHKRFVLKAADTIRFDRITSAFTAGVGAVNMICDILAIV